MATNNYHIPAYAQLKSPTQEVQQARLPPTSLQQAQVNYLLDKLQEEAAEVIQAVSKIRRFGPHNSHPDRKTTNKQELVTELEDFLAILAALEHARYLDPKPSQPNIQQKTIALLR
jgi:NTP pyrophosphatase (non-canonical NTP hydrolase)